MLETPTVQWLLQGRLLALTATRHVHSFTPLHGLATDHDLRPAWRYAQPSTHQILIVRTTKGRRLQVGPARVVAGLSPRRTATRTSAKRGIQSCGLVGRPHDRGLASSPSSTPGSPGGGDRKVLRRVPVALRGLALRAVPYTCWHPDAMGVARHCPVSDGRGARAQPAVVAAAWVATLPCKCSRRRPRLAKQPLLQAACPLVGSSPAIPPNPSRWAGPAHGAASVLRRPQAMGVTLSVAP